MHNYKEGLNDFLKGYISMFGLLFGCLVLQQLFVFQKTLLGFLFWMIFSGLAVLVSFYLFLKTLQPWVNSTVRIVFGIPLLGIATLTVLRVLRVFGFSRTQSLLGVFIVLIMIVGILIGKEVVGRY